MTHPIKITLPEEMAQRLAESGLQFSYMLPNDGSEGVGFVRGEFIFTEKLGLSVRSTDAEIQDAQERISSAMQEAAENALKVVKYVQELVK